MIGIYCRISKEKEQGKGQSLDDQRNQGIDLALQLKLDYKVYVDNGISGAGDKIEDRPEFERFIGDVSNGTLTHVFAYDQSRFERNPQVRYIITNLFKKMNITYITHMDGEVDLHDPQAEFMGDLLSVINKYQVTVTKIKVRSSLRNRALQGKGQAVMPYGYSKDKEGYIVIEPTEAEVVKRIFAMSLAGIGTRNIGDTLNEEGVPTRYNTIAKGVLKTKNKYTQEVTVTNKSDVKWSGNSVRGIIVNTIHKGEKRYKNEIISVPAILDNDYWERVNNNLALNRNNAGRINQFEYLLKGLLRCGVCGRNMYGKKRESKHDNHYMCSSKRIKGENCGNRSINIDKLDEFVWKKLFWKKGFLIQLHKELDNDSGDKFEKLKSQKLFIDKKISAYQEENENAITLMMKKPNLEERLSEAIEANDLKIAKLKDELIAIETTLKLNENTIHVLLKYKEMFDNVKGNEPYEVRKRVIHDFVKNIIVKYDASTKEYLLDFEYRVNLPKENYRSDIMPLAERVKKYAKKAEPAIFNTIITPTPKQSNECSTCRRRKLSSTWRNFNGT